MKKIYILDTNVLIHDPNSFKTFTGNQVIIPINVLEELDKLKSFAGEVGKNCRICIRMLEKYLEFNKDVKIDTNNYINKFGSDDSYVDNKILTCAVNTKDLNKKNKIILVSRDINLRVRAKALNLEVENYEKINIKDEIYSYKTIVNEEIGKILLKKDSFDICNFEETKNLKQNECVHFINEKNEGISLGRNLNGKINVIKNKKPWGLASKNKEQAFAIDMLCDSKLPLVSLMGIAGCGKTLISVASALEMVLEQKKYSKFLIYRPIQPVGKDIGYLPGQILEKLSPWMGAVFDSFEFLLGPRWKNILDRYLLEGIISLEAITYIRGRSINNAFILIDEAQNLSKEEAKTILTRCGHNSKIILTGDIEQIDNNSLDINNNGLTYIIDNFQNVDLAGHVTLTKGERSPLATVAAEIL